ncbi:diguanylate cyclase domain-containing protein [Undibacterium arcticum]
MKKDIRQLRQFDAELDVNLLRARLGTSADYAKLKLPLNPLQSLEQDLGQASYTKQSALLQQALQQLKVSFGLKQLLVGQFLAQDATLKDAIINFPGAIAQFQALLVKTAATGSPLEGQLLDALGNKVNNLLTVIFRFNLTPDQALGEQTIAAIDEIERYQTAYPPDVRLRLEQVLRHARTILSQRIVEDQLIANIAAAPTVVSVNALSSALDQVFTQALDDKQRYRSYLFAYAGVLLVLLLYLGLRLVKSYQVIAQVNKRLQASNETLERRVAERTAALEQQSAQMKQLATRDALTGLINRRQLMDLLAHALQRAERRASVVVVMFFDLDGFKAVNDTYGHACGDLVLQEVAQRVQRHMRQEDWLARLGGDEFVILLEEVRTRDGALRVAEETLTEIESITQIDGHPIAISASIGISSALGRASIRVTPDELLNQADHAMYQAKQDGKRCYRFSADANWSEAT